MLTSLDKKESIFSFAIICANSAKTHKKLIKDGEQGLEWNFPMYAFFVLLDF